MRPASSLLLSLLGFFGLSAWSRAGTDDSRPKSFALCAVVRVPDSDTVTLKQTTTGATLPLRQPPVLSSADLRRVKAVTSTKWYVLSGLHSTSSLVLRLRPEVVERVQAAFRHTVHRGEQLALVLGDEIIGLMFVQQSLAGDEIVIADSFFSQGTESEKSSATQSLARRIKSTLP